MEYKTILVHVDQSAQAGARIALAARIAMQHNAHLIGTALTNLPPRLFALSGLDPGLPPLDASLTELRRLADGALDAFEQQANALGVLSVERRRLEEEAGLGVSLQARYCDLVVIGRHDSAHASAGVLTGFPEYVLLNCARPVLVVPPTVKDQDQPIGQRIVVGWNGSAPATRAIASAIPMLQRARQVELVVFDAPTQGDVHGPSPGADMALYLARHDVRVMVRALDSHGDPGRALLAVASDAGADLIVMGAYGRSRFREVLLGGATRTMLKMATLPVWMAH